MDSEDLESEGAAIRGGSVIDLPASHISIEELARISREAVPFVAQLGIVIDEIECGAVTARVPFQEAFLRPGGTLAGPVLMSLADFVMWAVVLTLDADAIESVTTQLSINFLRRPEPGDLIARGSILKHGRRLSVGEVSLYSGEDERLVAHATCTYAMNGGAAGPG